MVTSAPASAIGNAFIMMVFDKESLQEVVASPAISFTVYVPGLA